MNGLGEMGLNGSSALRLGDEVDGTLAIKGPASLRLEGNLLIYTLEVEGRERMEERLSDLEEIVRSESLVEDERLPCAALNGRSFKDFRRAALAWARGYRPTPPTGCHFPNNLGYITLLNGRLSYVVQLPEAPKGEPVKKRQYLEMEDIIDDP